MCGRSSFERKKMMSNNRFKWTGHNFVPNLLSFLVFDTVLIVCVRNKFNAETELNRDSLSSFSFSPRRLSSRKRDTFEFKSMFGWSIPFLLNFISP